MKNPLDVCSDYSDSTNSTRNQCWYSDWELCVILLHLSCLWGTLSHVACIVSCWRDPHCFHCDLHVLLAGARGNPCCTNAPRYVRPRCSTYRQICCCNILTPTAATRAGDSGGGVREGAGDEGVLSKGEGGRQHARHPRQQQDRARCKTALAVGIH